MHGAGVGVDLDLADGAAVRKHRIVHLVVGHDRDAVRELGRKRVAARLLRELEIDRETGDLEIVHYVSVDDVGRCINPLIVEGQTHGAIAQGVGQAIGEACHLDPDTGQPLAGSLLDYGLPRAHNLPPFVTEIVEVLSPTNPLGIKAGGEGGTTAAPAAVIGAVVDALRDYGVTDIKMPATPYAIWRAMQQAPAQGPSR